MTVGATASRTYPVAADDTARALGSGSLDVLATPRLLAWMEAQCCAVLEEALSDAETSVGTRVNIEHLAASLVGSTVDVTARVTHVDGRRIRFECVAVQADVLCGRAELTRVVVDRGRFLERARR